YEKLATAERKEAGLAQDLIKAERRSKLQDLVSPVDGVVQQLSVHTVGGVVTPAQVLAVIVPLNSRLEIQATLSNDDVGFVHAGQQADIKVQTFNFTRYGLLHGRVLEVSPDAITRVGDNGWPPGRNASQSDPQHERDLVYAARISLDRRQMKIGKHIVALSPGMAVTVEVKTGSRRIIGYLLSPLSRYEHDVLRER
ncbi:MAG: HlyD family efflux transporter periplasmic adaptor subunit, partial [Gemmataceae bacterium]